MAEYGLTVCIVRACRRGVVVSLVPLSQGRGREAEHRRVRAGQTPGRGQLLAHRRGQAQGHGRAVRSQGDREAAHQAAATAPPEHLQ
ncbi:hypothetical protein ON010_g5615 [Phytophthora cinnamomi]|nr:hypothetical protein ON010_g5615 [Phytophthora cinnamomi]